MGIQRVRPCALAEVCACVGGYVWKWRVPLVCFTKRRCLGTWAGRSYRGDRACVRLGAGHEDTRDGGGVWEWSLVRSAERRVWGPVCHISRCEQTRIQAVRMGKEGREMRNICETRASVEQTARVNSERSHSWTEPSTSSTCHGRA
jgi:hypothetical protein